jgi:type IV pilus assembly protein PilV
MKQTNYKKQSQRGFSIIEVMVSALVVSVSVLGMTGMQITAKRAGLEAIQRTSATSLAMDLIERMRANPKAISSYVTTSIGGGSISVEPVPDCSYDSTNTCTGAQLAVHDLWEWEQAIDGATETRLVEGDAVAVGGLFDPTACVSVNGGAVTISMAWEGYQVQSNPTFDTCGAGLGKYGTEDAKRQVVSMTTFITEQ